jgi:hypothetical protein
MGQGHKGIFVLLFVMAALGLAFAAGRLTTPAARAPVPPPADSRIGDEEHQLLRRQMDALARAQPRAPTSPTDIQAAVRAELERFEAEKRPAKPTAEEPPVQTPQFATSMALVSSALESRTWTDEDREKLHGLIRQLDRSQRKAVMTRLSRAINDGQLHVESEDVVF